MAIHFRLPLKGDRPAAQGVGNYPIKMNQDLLPTRPMYESAAKQSRGTASRRRRPTWCIIVRGFGSTRGTASQLPPTTMAVSNLLKRRSFSGPALGR